MKKKELPLDMYILFLIFFLHLLIVLTNLSRPYYVVFGLFYQELGISTALIYSEALLIIVIAFLFFRRIRWARQIGIIFYSILLANTLISVMPAIFFRIELGSYLSQVITQDNLFQVYLVNIFAKALICIFAIFSIRKNTRYLKF